jgi:hypothetical protein
LHIQAAEEAKRKAEEEAKRKVPGDLQPLTPLPSRAAFERLLERALCGLGKWFIFSQLPRDFFLKKGLTFAKNFITMYQKWAEKPTQCTCACVNIGRQIRPYEDM